MAKLNDKLCDRCGREDYGSSQIKAKLLKKRANGFVLCRSCWNKMQGRYEYDYPEPRFVRGK